MEWGVKHLEISREYGKGFPPKWWISPSLFLGRMPDEPTNNLSRPSIWRREAK